MVSHPEPDAGWSAVIVYGDDPARRRALHTLNNVVHVVDEKSKLCPQLWRFDLLEDPDRRAEAAFNTRLADLFIISTSSKGALSAAVQDWVQSSLSQKQGNAAVVVALLGPADDTDAPDSPRVQFLRNAAEAAGLSFFAPAPPAAPLMPARLAPRVLLVEDDRVIRQVSALVLDRAGCQVNAIETGEAAWEALQSGTYDLLITDNRMPGISGLELVRKLRAMHLALPVILASGGMGAEELTQNPWLQPATVLPKPFTGDALSRTVTELLVQAGRGVYHPKKLLQQPTIAYERGGLNE